MNFLSLSVSPKATSWQVLEKQTEPPDRNNQRNSKDVTRKKTRHRGYISFPRSELCFSPRFPLRTFLLPGQKIQHISECSGTRRVTIMCKSNFWIVPHHKSMASWNLPRSSAAPLAITSKERITPNKLKQVSVHPYIAPQPTFSYTEHTLHGLPFNYWILSRVLPTISSRNASWRVLFTPKWHLTPFHAIPLHSMDERAKFRFTALQSLYSSQHKTRERASRCRRWCSALVRTNGKSMLQTALYRLALLTLAVTKLQLELG